MPVICQISDITLSQILLDQNETFFLNILINNENLCHQILNSINICSFLNKVKRNETNPQFLKLAQKHINNKNLHWQEISKKNLITPDFILKNAQILKPWNWCLSSLKYNLDLKFVEYFIFENWNFYELTKYFKIPIDFILKFNEKLWDFYSITEFKDVTIEIIDRFNDKCWNWKNFTS